MKSSVWQDPFIWMVWSWCLMKAAHTTTRFPFNGEDMVLEPGQFVAGRKKACEQIPTSTPQKYRTAMEYLKSTSRITIKTYNKFSIVTVLNWSDYQKNNQLDNQPVTNQQPASNQQITTYKKIKNVKKIKNKTSTNVLEGKAFGNEKVNWLLAEFEKTMGFPSSGKKAKDRQMAWSLLREYSEEQITYMLQYCTTQQYAPRVGSIEKLWYKRGDIVAGIKSLQNKQSKQVTIIS